MERTDTFDYLVKLRVFIWVILSVFSHGDNIFFGGYWIVLKFILMVTEDECDVWEDKIIAGCTGRDFIEKDFEVDCGSGEHGGSGIDCHLARVVIRTEVCIFSID